MNTITAIISVTTLVNNITLNTTVCIAGLKLLYPAVTIPYKTHHDNETEFACTYLLHAICVNVV